MAETIERKVDRINEKITTLLQIAKTEPVQWVKASVITKLTGWECEEMRTARRNGYIQYKKDEKKKSFWYDLKSLDQFWYKKTQ